jgi:hypothetical protein
MGRWVEAAGNITQPVNVTTYPGTGFSEERPAPTNAPVRMRGESLRSKSKPSVTELLARCATEIPPSNPGAYDLSAGCELGLRLTAWEPRSALAVAKTLTERCLTVRQYSDQKNPWLVVAKLTLFRMEAGDPQAFEDYAAWLQSTTPEQLELRFAEPFVPLCKYATNAVLQTAAERIFGNTNSPWGRLPWKQTGSYDPVGSDLVNVSAFRRLLVRELDKKVPCGTVEWRQGVLWYQLRDYMNGNESLTWPGESRPTEDKKAALRWCDWIAWSLGKAKRIPFFNLFAPLEERDQAIAKAKAFLEPR